LVDCGIFEHIYLNFLPVGHTHCDIDQLFSRVATFLKGMICTDCCGPKHNLRRTWKCPVTCICGQHTQLTHGTSLQRQFVAVTLGSTRSLFLTSSSIGVNPLIRTWTRLLKQMVSACVSRCRVAVGFTNLLLCTLYGLRLPALHRLQVLPFLSSGHNTPWSHCECWHLWVQARCYGSSVGGYKVASR